MASRKQPTPASKPVGKVEKSLKAGRFEARIEPDTAAALEEIGDTFAGVGNPSSVGRMVLELGVRCFWVHRGGTIPASSKAVIARVADQHGDH